jgi:hypothetical protein
MFYVYAAPTATAVFLTLILILYMLSNLIRVCGGPHLLAHFFSGYDACRARSFARSRSSDCARLKQKAQFHH